MGGTLTVDGTGPSVAVMMDRLRVVHQASMLRTSREPRHRLLESQGREEFPNLVGGTTEELVIGKNEGKEEVLSWASAACVNVASSRVKEWTCIVGNDKTRRVVMLKLWRRELQMRILRRLLWTSITPLFNPSVSL